MVSLIERFYEPLAGSILLDGHNIKGLDIKWLRNQIGLVNQEPALFATSIRENILYGKDDATINDINHAAKLSEAITFINHLPDRYETQVCAFHKLIRARSQNMIAMRYTNLLLKFMLCVPNILSTALSL